MPGAVEKTFNKVLTFLLERPQREEDEVRGYVNSIISPTSKEESTWGCVQGAVEGWFEVREILTKGLPGARAAAGLWAATRCAIGAI